MMYLFNVKLVYTKIIILILFIGILNELIFDISITNIRKYAENKRRSEGWGSSHYSWINSFIPAVVWICKGNCRSPKILMEILYYKRHLYLLGGKLKVISFNYIINIENLTILKAIKSEKY